MPLIPFPPTSAPLSLTPPASPARLDDEAATAMLLAAAGDVGLGFFQVDLGTGATRWSSAVFDLFGVAADDGPDGLHDRIHPGDATARRAAVEAALAAGAGAGTGVGYTAEFRVLLPGGASRWLSERGRVVAGDGSGAARLVGTVTDDTARRAAEAELAANGQRRDRFLALLAHDLRNPLAPLHTAAELMRRSEMQPARVRTISDMLTRQVAQMSQLIDDLVDVSRAGQGRIELRRQTVDVAQVVARAVEAVRGFVERRRQGIETRLDAPVATLDADPERLLQILTHLLEHASRDSTEDAVIRVAVESVPGELRLSVADDGAGIEPERLAQVFDLYPPAEVDPQRRQTLGTGMALVKALTLLHGGSVEAASAGSGQGATYTVRLPLA